MQVGVGLGGGEGGDCHRVAPGLVRAASRRRVVTSDLPAGRRVRRRRPRAGSDRPGCGTSSSTTSHHRSAVVSAHGQELPRRFSGSSRSASGSPKAQRRGGVGGDDAVAGGGVPTPARPRPLPRRGGRRRRRAGSCRPRPSPPAPASAPPCRLSSSRLLQASGHLPLLETIGRLRNSPHPDLLAGRRPPPLQPAVGRLDTVAGIHPRLGVPHAASPDKQPHGRRPREALPGHHLLQRGGRDAATPLRQSRVAQPDPAAPAVRPSTLPGSGSRKDRPSSPTPAS